MGFGGLGWSPVRTAALVLGVAVVVVTSPAAAGPDFPGAIQDYLARTGGAPDCAVPCTLCHAGPQGGKENVRTVGFTENLRGFGVKVEGLIPVSVVLALEAMARTPCPDGSGTPCNSDKEGGHDLAELHAGTDPDGRRNFDDCLKYGCGATIAPRGPERTELGPLWLVGALGGAALLRRARRAGAAGKS
jgi:hypothetical protein